MKHPQGLALSEVEGTTEKERPYNGRQMSADENRIASSSLGVRLIYQDWSEAHTEQQLGYAGRVEESLRHRTPTSLLNCCKVLSSTCSLS